MTLWSQALEIARVDLQVERRLGDTARIILPFAVVALLVFPLAMGARLAEIRAIGPAVFWSLGILFGMQVALRQSATDSPTRRDMYALIGLDPVARLLGRAMSGGVLLTGFLLVLFLAMVVLYGPELASGSWWVLVVGSLLFAIGLTQLSTLAGEVTAGLRNRAGMASLIIAPLSIPLVIGASQALAAISGGTGILPWILLMVATDMALAVVGIGLARPLEEASR
ncbi:MAG TPA: heme exporter protein CcmB [Acidimicrobiia bacterium]